MERDGVDLSFQNGKRRKVADNNSIRSDEAKDALNTVESMRLAGLRRAALPRWYGIGIALLVAVGFALYAQKDPGKIPGLIIALGAPDGFGNLGARRCDCVYVGTIFRWNFHQAGLRSRVGAGVNRTHCWYYDLPLERK
jgi:hypothetical protein